MMITALVITVMVILCIATLAALFIGEDALDRMAVALIVASWSSVFAIGGWVFYIIFHFVRKFW